jgi:hypothetical protein
VPRSPRDPRSFERPDDIAVDDFVKYFKERVYATFTGLAIVLVTGAGAHPEARTALIALALGVGGIVAAGFVSDVIAHMAVHRTLPAAKDWVLLLRIAGGGLSTAVTPAILLLLGALGVLRDETALTAATVVYIVTLGVIGWLVVRRARLVWWKQLVVLAVLVILGLLVIGIQSLAHGLGAEP